MKNNIDKIEAVSINDSRGNPTILVTVFSEGYSASFSVPSGASTGIHEAHELRDADGKGVSVAIGKIKEVASPALLGVSVLDQKNIDNILISLDGTLNKSNLGGNVMIGVSIACLKLAAKINNLETYQYIKTFFPKGQDSPIIHLYLNLINGGKHAKNNLAFQEYHIVTEVLDIKEAVNIGLLIQNSLEEIIKRELDNESLVLGDEGGFAPRITDIRTPLLYLKEAIKENNLENKVRLALDVAASSFFENGVYLIDGKNVTKEKLAELYDSLIKEFNIFSIEDPFEEEDFESFKNLKDKHPELVVVGDDLTVTNKILLEKAIKENSINGMIIKPNQIGTVTEMFETMNLAIDNNIKLIISHRSGETEDDFIADLAYAVGSFGLKSGSPRKKERMVKYERLIKINQK